MNPIIIKEALRMAIESRLSANVRVEYSSQANMYYAYLWRDDVVKGAVTEKKTNWEKLKKSFETYCMDLRKAMNAGLDSDAHLTFMVLNDRNPEETLLTITDGVTHYDFMTEVFAK
jgi:hypothetical protein